MRHVVLLVVLLAIMLGTTHAEAVVLKFEGDGSQYRNQMIFKGWNKPIGKIGDYVELGDGSYNLRVAAPRHHSVILRTRIEGNELKISLDKRQGRDKNGCIAEWKTTWGANSKNKPSRTRMVSSGMSSYHKYVS